MSRRILPLAALVAVALACSERATPPTDPGPGPGAGSTLPDQPPPADVPAEQAALEALAREVALALGGAEFRARVREQLDRSPFREQKVHVQETLLGNPAALQQALVSTQVATSRLLALADRATPAELYFPVESHRFAWTGDDRVLVATAMDDFDPPVAFDTEGRRTVLDPFTPPATPVLALVPRETPILRRAAAKCLTEECTQPSGGGGGTAGGGGKGGPSLAAGVLTLSHAEFVDDFEGWLKGDPEYEIHVLGPVSQTDTTTLTSYQCVGEHAPAPFSWDMNAQTWDGSAKVFTYEQMDAFETAFPNRAYVIMALEDDTDACVITSDANQFKDMIGLLRSAYDQFTAAKDKKIGFSDADRILAAARTGADLIAAIGNFITTRDDAIGIAVADTVAGRSHPNSNWVVLNKDNNVTGWLRLDMR